MQFKNFELNTLTHLCRVAITEVDQDFSLKNSTVDWEKVWQLACHHKVRPLAYLGICQSKLEKEIPPEIVGKFKNFAFQRTIFNLKQTQELLKLTKIFQKNGIKVVPYKGVVLAQEAYNNIAAREFSDLDLLVDVKDFSKIKNLLYARDYKDEIELPAGYWPIYKQYNCEFNFDYYQSGRRIFHVEPHWYLGKRFQQLNFSIHDFNSFWKKESFLGTEIEKLSPEGLLLTTFVHHIGKEIFFSLKHASDIAAIMIRFEDKLDWEKIWKQSKKMDIEGMLFISIGLVNRIFHLPIPIIFENILATEQNNRLINRQIDFLTLESFPTRSVSYFYEFMKFNMEIRKKKWTKLKILSYHIIQAIRPNIDDLPAQPFSRRNYLFLYFKKSLKILQRKN